MNTAAQRDIETGESTAMSELADRLGVDLAELYNSAGTCAALWNEGNADEILGIEKMALSVCVTSKTGRRLPAGCTNEIKYILIRVAEGKTIPEVCQAFRYNQEIMRKIADWPIQAQRELIDAGKLEAQVRGPNDTIDTQIFKLDDFRGNAGRRTANRLFGKYGLRDKGEQNRLIQDALLRTPTAGAKGKGSPNHSFDKKRKLVRYNGTGSISVSEMMDFIREI